MKKLLLFSLTLSCAASVFAQGSVYFANVVSGTISARVYSSKPGDPLFQQIGNSATQTPSGSVDWTGFTALSGTSYLAALMGATGGGQPESSLGFAPETTTFRTGSAAGVLVSVSATLPGVAAGAPLATVQMFAWDNTSGLYASASSAWTAWKAGAIAGGASGTFNVADIGGGSVAPPNLLGLRSFNLYMVPEPSTMALAGLGAAALLIFRRRK